MFYLDSERTITRRDSSLIVSRRDEPEADDDFEPSTGGRTRSIPFVNESMLSMAVSSNKLPKRTEIITMMFESMLGSIVESWEVIEQKEAEKSVHEPVAVVENNTKKKKVAQGKSSRTRRSQSKAEDIGVNSDIPQADPMQICWWSAPDEKAVIHFKNGNKYEGNISMKCMHGEGRFQWADGTVYLGNFENNKICGNGTIYWKDDTWYQGEFLGNLRHGRGLYVDSRKQRSYTGGWHCGTKHGEGVIYYNKSFKDSYDGEWIYNERTGFGSREYSAISGYKGEWDRNIIEGKGLMIWPNHDFYRGDWKNGRMSGNGIYIWDAYFNNSMSLPSINAYRGQWHKGQRHGYGLLNLGLGLGSFYKGEFKHNKKHGIGKFVTNSGLIIQDRPLFIDDNIRPAQENIDVNLEKLLTMPNSMEPYYKFDLCDRTVGLLYHIDQALQNIDKQEEIRTNIINDYLRNNKYLYKSLQTVTKEVPAEKPMAHESVGLLVQFEEISLLNALRCYETDLSNIYYRYATVCNTQKIPFTPILIRLYLWQLYFDCNVHQKGLTLVQIDNIYHNNPEWLSVSPHNPFEKIYFWQFLHSLISVARILYAKKELPETKPDTILAKAFREFMEKDILPGSTKHKGYFANGYGVYVPLQATYALYRRLGEPHTIRTFLCAVRRPIHYFDRLQPPLIDPPKQYLPLGRNVYIFGDEMTFVTDDNDVPELLDECNYIDVKLFNIANLSSKKIINIFATIFPQACESNKIMDLNIELTFFEFFQAFIACADESIALKNAELNAHIVLDP